MAVSDVHGTAFPGIGSPVTLADTSAAATYQLTIELGNLAAGDVLEVRIWKKVLTGGTRGVAYFARRSDAQPADDRQLLSVPISTALADSGAIRAEITQTKGSSRNFDWCLEKFA